ncbi:MAG: hypothetical protein QOF52_2437 [Propionibacteriaceae bacterium]|nr:hypothetical protein [Propionibacteriaceae bacterium]MDX6322579.1 hypothetical protein [Propionibacteriaceae bacterium]
MSNASPYGGTDDRQFEASGVFRIEQQNGRWWFVDPSGAGFLTVGVAHADDSDLKYLHNVDIWREKYGSSKERWIREGLVPDLDAWGFNTIGWTQDYVGGGWRKAFDWNERVTVQQSTSQFSPRDFEVADRPYVVLMEVAKTEDWYGDPVFPDVFSEDFEDHCAYLTRSTCVDHARSSNLIGYSYDDAPSWARHVSGADFPQLIDLPENKREDRLFEIASKYYETMHRHIRQHDSEHLILGDLYNGDRPLPDAVLEAMKPYVDVLGIQYFPGDTDEAKQRMIEHASAAVALTGKPLYVPDIGNWAPTELNPHRVGDPSGRLAGLDSHAERARHYIETIGVLLEQPWFLGFHWCAYLENKARGWGIKDPWDRAYEDFTGPVAEFNKSIYDRIRS